MLYTYPDNFRAHKALIAAQYSGRNLKLAPGFTFGETNKSAEFLSKFPAGKVPAFESDDGRVRLTESNAIAWYVADEALRGAGPEAAAGVWQWASWADGEVLPAAAGWVFPYLGVMPHRPAAVTRARQDLLDALRVLDTHLASRTFLVGERVSLADVVVFCTLQQAATRVLEPAARADLPHVCRWWRTLAAQPQVRAVLGDLALCAAAPALPAQAHQPHQQQPQQQQHKKVTTVTVLLC